MATGFKVVSTGSFVPPRLVKYFKVFFSTTLIINDIFFFLILLGQQQQQQPAEPEEPLPPGWEMRFDSYGRKYYVDHNTRFVDWLIVHTVSYVWEARAAGIKLGPVYFYSWYLSSNLSAGQPRGRGPSRCPRAGRCDATPGMRVSTSWALWDSSQLMAKDIYLTCFK